MGIRVIVAGANGRMGQEVVKMVQNEDDLTMVGAVSRAKQGHDIGEVMGIGKLGVRCAGSLEESLASCSADVLVDFTTAPVAKAHMELALEAGVRAVVGTTGFLEEDLQALGERCEKYQMGAIVAPNFAISAVLMMVFASQAVKYLPHVEIIESHHDRKLDAPSGTAIKTAELIAANRPEIRQGHAEEKELLTGARGAYAHGFRIHSVRLPGLVSHQEVLFGSQGQLLTIRHDALQREAFMPGVKLALEKVIGLDRLVYGLEKILDL
jgi:4-hydroxy-tetrahydrodipicolinate reductase